MHQENVQQKNEDLKALQGSREELRSDRKEARFEKMDQNNDGTVDEAERKAWKESHFDKMGIVRDHLTDHTGYCILHDNKTRIEYGVSWAG